MGDVHGEDQSLARALEGIRNTERHAKNSKIVLLGDLIDRGPGSIAALDLMLNAEEHAQVDEVIFLPGNHELMLDEALITNDEADRQFMGSLWLKNGGVAVLEEAGFSLDNMSSYEELLDRVRAALPREFNDLCTMWGHHREGDLLFVHAGINPYVDQEGSVTEIGDTASNMMREADLDRILFVDQDCGFAGGATYTDMIDAVGSGLGSDLHARDAVKASSEVLERLKFWVPGPDGRPLGMSA